MALAAKSDYPAPETPAAYDPGMKTPLIASGIFHVVLVLVFTVGLPFISPPPELMEPPPITVELVELSEMTATPRVAKPQKPKEEPKPPEPTPKKEAPPKVNSETPPDIPKPKPPETKTAEPVPDLEPPKPLEKPEEKKPEPKPEPKKEEPKKEEPTKKVEPEKQQDDFQSLLKNLTPDKEEPSEGDEIADKEAEPQESQIARIGDKLTMSEEDALRRQLAGCWNVLAGAKNAEELIIEVRVDVNRDRTVNRASILDKGRYNRDNHFRAAADAAIRALSNPKCIPLALPPEKYDQWKTTIIRFDPRDML
jgi:hypothetical protein